MYLGVRTVDEKESYRCMKKLPPSLGRKEHAVRCHKTST